MKKFTLLNNLTYVLYLLLKSSFLCLLLSISINIFAQQECATPDPTEAELQAMPWYGNPDYLNDYIDSIKVAYSGNGTTGYAVEDRVRHRIPIHFWIFREGI